MKVALLVLWVLLTACASHMSKHSIILEYDDFGPQAMAYKIIGKKRMPWAPEIPVMIGDDHIYVVVYKSVDREDLNETFKPDRDHNIDYRFVSYNDAITYLDTQIAQNILRKVTAKLEVTRSKIQVALASR